MASHDKFGGLLPALGLLVGCGDRSADFAEVGDESDDVADEASSDTGDDTSSGESSDDTSSDDTDTDTSSGDTDTDTSSDTGDEGFYITEVSPAQGSTLTLTFSEPVGDLAGIDPNDFRISVATSFWSYEYGMVYESSQYFDLTIYEYGVYPYVNFTFEALTPGQAANEVVLHLDRTIPPYACEYIEYFNSQEPPDFPAEFEKLMLLHHAGGDIPIHGVDEVPLGDFGADWVNDPSWVASIEEAGFPKLGVRVEIPCP